MADKREDIDIEEVLDTEVDDIWDIFFPYMNEKKENSSKADAEPEMVKQHRNLKFLSM